MKPLRSTRDRSICRRVSFDGKKKIDLTGGVHLKKKKNACEEYNIVLLFLLKKLRLKQLAAAGTRPFSSYCRFWVVAMPQCRFFFFSLSILLFLFTPCIIFSLSFACCFLSRNSDPAGHILDAPVSIRVSFWLLT